MLARYDRYILGRLMVTFGFFTFIIVLIYWINRSIRLFDRVVGDGQSVTLFTQLSLLSLPYLMYLMLPLSAFAASVSTGNRMGSDSETVALQAAGISAFRIARPAFYLGVLAALLMLLLAHVVVPISRVTIVEVEARLADQVGARLLEPGQFQSPVDGITVFVSDISDQGIMNKVLLSDQRTPENPVIYTANQALIVRSDGGRQLVMLDGQAQSLDANNALSVLQFEDFALGLGEAELPEYQVLRDLRGYDTPTLLRADPELVSLLQKRKADFMHEAHRRFATPALAVATAVLGMATLMVGGFSRFGFWQQVAGAIVLIIIIQLTANWVEEIALKNDDAWPLLYAPALLAASIVAVLLWISDHPLLVRRRLSRAKTNGSSGGGAQNAL